MHRGAFYPRPPPPAERLQRGPDNQAIWDRFSVLFWRGTLLMTRVRCPHKPRRELRRAVRILRDQMAAEDVWSTQPPSTSLWTPRCDPRPARLCPGRHRNHYGSCLGARAGGHMVCGARVGIMHPRVRATGLPMTWDPPATTSKFTVLRPGCSGSLTDGCPVGITQNTV